MSSEDKEPKRLFIIQKSGNKLKKWVVKEKLTPLPNVVKEVELPAVEQEEPELAKAEDEPESDVEEVPTPEAVEGKKKYNPFPYKKRGRKPAVKEPKPEKVRYGKPVFFGQQNYRDYVIMNQPGYELKNAEEPDYIKEIYLKRHGKEDWTDLKKAGTWSRYITWNKPTMEESAKDMSEKFGIRILLDLDSEPVKRVIKKKEDNAKAGKEE